MMRRRRYRLALTPHQVALAERTGDITRFVWNCALEQRREGRRRGRFYSYEEQAGQLVEAKRESSWLVEAPAHCLQQTLRDLDQACRRHGAFRVHWKSKARSEPSFRFPDPKAIAIKRINRRWSAVKLPKLGWCRFRWSRGLGGEVRNATVLREGEHWFVSICVQAPDVAMEPNGRPAVGVDRGVAVAVATSDGDMLDFEPLTPKEQERIVRLQRHLAKQKRGSNRRARTKRAIGKFHARARHRRGDFCHKASTDLAKNHGLVAIEDLNVKGMTASAKGTVETPGERVRQKAGLNRAILSKGWSIMAEHLPYKCDRHGSMLVKPPAPKTSQTCSACRVVDAGARQGRWFRCRVCGNHMDADVNAAINIRERGIKLALAAGLAVTAQGAILAGAMAMNCEPPGSIQESSGACLGVEVNAPLSKHPRSRSRRRSSPTGPQICPATRWRTRSPMTC